MGRSETRPVRSRTLDGQTISIARGLLFLTEDSGRGHKGWRITARCDGPPLAAEPPWERAVIAQLDRGEVLVGQANIVHVGDTDLLLNGASEPSGVSGWEEGVGE